MRRAYRQGAAGSNVNTCFFIYPTPFVHGNFPAISDITPASSSDVDHNLSHAKWK
jgi:hypothetical protein